MIRVAPTAKRVRAYLAGEQIVDSTAVKLVWEKPYYPTYYFPLDDVAIGVLQASGKTERSPSRGDARFYDVVVNGSTARDAAYDYPDPKIEELADHVAFTWAAMDSWFEEDEEVFVHARDPYKRVDILRSSRRIEVSVNGVAIADSEAPSLLFETELPARFYLPSEDVKMDLLIPSETKTDCPYKGTASYWSVQAGPDLVEDIVWSYPDPVAESAKIAGLLCFYNERVDIKVDGVLQGRPKSVFS